MAAVRSAYVASKRGTTNFQITTVRITTKTTEATISTGLGRSGFSVASGNRALIGSAEDEGERDADDGQSLGHGEADPRGPHHGPAGLGLPGRALDDGGEDQADTDTRPDGAQAVADDAERSGELHCSQHWAASFRGDSAGAEGQSWIDTWVSAPRRWRRRCTGRSRR